MIIRKEIHLTAAKGRKSSGGDRVKWVLVAVMAVLTCLAFAGGQQEDPLEQAERLIEEKKYGEALQLLAEVRRTEPEKTDAVDRLTERIFLDENTVNDMWEDLNRTLYDEKDSEGGLAIIRRIEEFYPNPGPAMLAALNEAKRGALLVANESRFYDVMDRALVLLLQDRYFTAAETYLEARDVYRDVFYEAGHGNIIENAVGEGGARVGSVGSARCAKGGGRRPSHRGGDAFPGKPDENTGVEAECPGGGGYPVRTEPDHKAEQPGGGRGPLPLFHQHPPHGERGKGGAGRHSGNLFSAHGVYLPACR
jgi:hypothetical protein